LNRIIAIHDAVYNEVHRPEEVAIPFNTNPTYPAIKQCHDVMVPMKKNDVFFAKYKQCGVKQLSKFCASKIEEPWIAQVGVHIAKGTSWAYKPMLETVLDQRGHHKARSTNAEKRKQSVSDRRHLIQSKWLPCLHILLP